MFRVADQDFEIEKACLELFCGYEEQTVCWGVKILAKGQGREVEGIAGWDPAILADRLMETGSGQVAHWYDIAGTSLGWVDPAEDPQAFFEVYETSAIYRCTWQFVAVPGTHRVRLIFEGTTDIDAEYEKVPVTVDTTLTIAP